MKTKLFKGMTTIDIVRAMQSGWTEKELEIEFERMDKETAKEDGKIFGECESCGSKTVLVEEVGLCGPCCFGESETANGNW